MNEQVECPGGCGNRVHRRATECPQCGYLAEVTRYYGLLGSLSTISSILIGFGLASLVSLAGDRSGSNPEIVVQVAAGAWSFSSILLLAVLVLSEWARRQEPSDTIIGMPVNDQNRIIRRCEVLLGVFLLALLLMALGIVLLGFHFSLVHGLLGVAAVAVAAGVIVWARG